jgi:branched-chain amino acid transport system substrate-binding protein
MRVRTRTGKLAVGLLVAPLLLTAACGRVPAPTKADDAGGGGHPQLDASGKVICRDGSPGVTAKELRFGVDAELTGKAALSGAIAKRSLDMVVDDINSSGGILGKQVTVSYNDNQSSNPGAVNALNKSVSGDNVFALIGPIRSTQVQAMNEIIKAQRIPTMIGATNASLTEQGGGLIFRFRPPDSLTGKAIVAYAQKEFKPRKIAILHDSDAFGSGGAAVVEKAAKEAGIAVQKASYTTGDKDYTAQLSTLRSYGPDVIATYATNSEDVAIFARQMQELGINTPVVGGPSITSQVSFDLGQKYIQGWRAIVDFRLGSNEVNKAWAAEYEQRYASKPDLFGAWQRDAMYFMKSALEKSGCDRQAFVKALHEVEIDGVQGPLKSNKQGDVNSNLLVVQVKDGSSEFVADATKLLPVS